MRLSRIRSLTFVAISVAILCVGSQISIPTPFLVPVTLQVIFVSLSAHILGLKKSLIALLAYVLIGAFGVPVFAGFGAGFSTLFGYTGGFIFGFFPLAILSSLGRGKIKILFSLIGVVLCHLIGVLQYSIVAKINPFLSFVTMSLPYIFKDFLLVILAYFISASILKKIKKS